MWIRRAARSLLGLALLAWAGGSFVPVLAQPAARAPQDEQMIATLRVNGVRRGDFAVLRTAAGDWWIGADDFAKLKLAAREGASRQFAGETWYSLTSLGAQSVVFDEAQLTLSVDFPAATLEGSRIDMSARPAPPVPMQQQNSLILSYRLAVRRTGRDRPTEAALTNDLNARVGGLLLRQETRLRWEAQHRGFVRGPTQAIWDDQRRGTRWIAGDVVTPGGPYGSTMRAAGLLYAKLFDLTPDLIRYPAATLHASARQPAEVELSVDGTPIMRTRVGPGPIALENLLLYGGTRNLRVTVTDASGRREVFEQPFFFTDQVLVRGLHDFAYFIGKRADTGPQERIRYLEPAWQGVHRYGLTDSLTVSAGGEGSKDFSNAGAGLTLRMDTLGLLSLDVLASADRAADRRAMGWAGRYAFIRPGGSVLLSHRRYGRGFRSFTTSPESPHLERETRVGLSAGFAGISAALELQRSVDARETRDAAALRFSTNIGRDATLSGQYQITSTNGQRERSAYVFVRLELDRLHWVSSNVRSSGPTRGIAVETGRQIERGEGFGYRVGVDAAFDPMGDSTVAHAAGTLNLKPASVEFFGSSQLRGGEGRYAEVAVSGALVAIDGYLAATRRVDGSFVLARLGVPQPGVDILLNNQVQGKTDAEGKLFIPQVGAFGRQTVGLDDKQLPMQFGVKDKHRTITVPYRSGTVVDFGARRVRALAGFVWHMAAGRRQPAAYARVEMRGPAALTLETTGAGDFYVDDAAPGNYTGSLALAGKVYSCRMTVPDFAEAVHELTEGVICD